jgi:acyl carrier protein
MNKEQIKTFKQYLADKLGFYLKDIKNKTELAIDLGMDDLDFIEIIMYCEVKFNIVIVDEEADKCITVNDFIEMLKACRSSK